MKKTFILSAFVLLLTTPCVGQKRRTAAPKTPAVPYIEQARQALAEYRFEQAEELLDKEIEALRKKKQDASEAEALKEQASMGQIKLHATEHVVVIDSMVCSKTDMIKAIRLSHECGRIDTYASTYHTADNNGATIYENEFANKRLLAVPSANGSKSLRLALSDKVGQEWSSPTLLTGLNEDDRSQNYPFLLSDGVTLYYAASGPESFGGYDIFISRADGEDGSFLSPENMGFPFNSTANDYLLAIDEYAQLGWFVSDRFQPEGKVCIYTFIPNSTRVSYGDEVSEDQLRARARLTSIRDTWKHADNKAITAAQQRLAALRQGQGSETKTDAFNFAIDDSRTYTQLTDFRSPIARQKMQQWLELSKALDTDAIMLQRLRDNYANSAATDRQRIAASIQQLETSYYPQLRQLRQLAKEIRNTEITHK